MSDSDPAPAVDGLLPRGRFPRLVVALHALVAVVLLAFAATAVGRSLVQAGLMTLVAAMLLTVGVAAGRLAARQ